MKTKEVIERIALGCVVLFVLAVLAFTFFAFLFSLTKVNFACIVLGYLLCKLFQKSK